MSNIPTFFNNLFNLIEIDTRVEEQKFYSSNSRKRLKDNL